MELLQLRYFLKAAQTEHMTRAAEALGIAQPTLSKSIRLLEKELGVSLFNRSGKTTRLNAKGRVFSERVSKALSELEEGKRELLYMEDPDKAPIRLAFLAASPLLPVLLGAFRKRYPDTAFTLIQQLNGAASGDFDLCVSSLPLPIPGLSRRLLLTEAFYLAVPTDHPLADRKSIQLREASGEGFIQLKAGNNLRTITENFCIEAGFTPQTLYETDNPGTLRGLITAGQGVGFIPALTWHERSYDTIRLIKITEPVCRRNIWLSWRENGSSSERLKVFRQFMFAYFETLQKEDHD